MPPINLLIKPASSMCNMKCDYCFYYDESEKRKQASFGLMSEKTLKNVIRKAILYAEGNCTIAFQGGEPTLCGIGFYENVLKYVKQYNKNQIRVEYALQTNGYGITKEWCEFFAKNKFLIGLSIDGTEEIHDTYRHNSQGENTYQRIVETAKLFDKYQVEYNVLTVVHRQVAENIEEIYKNYKKNGWKYLQFITCLDPLGERRGQKEFSLLPESYGEFLIKLFKLWYKDYKKGKQPFIRQFENYIAMMMGYYPESCEQRGVCGIQHVVEADGCVYPCDFYVLDEFNLGNLNEISMTQIQTNRQEIGFIERSQNNSAKCKACQWDKLCRGGCYRNREGIEDNYFCKSYQMFFETCYKHMKEITNDIFQNSK